MYCTVEDITNQLSFRILLQLTDDNGTGAPDVQITDKAIGDAVSEIDGYIGVKYATPIFPVPEIIRKYAVDIAIYNLSSRREQGPPEIYSDRYKNAISFLKRVSSGTVSLGSNDPGGNPVNKDTPVPDDLSNPARLFTRDSMRHF